MSDEIEIRSLTPESILLPEEPSSADEDEV